MNEDGHTFMHTLIPDIASAVAVLGALAGYLPPLATLLAILWYCAMIYDWVAQKRAAHQAKTLDLQPGENLHD